MIRIKILKKFFVILSLLLAFSVGSAISHSAHAQLFNSSKKKSSNVYSPTKETQSQNAGHSSSNASASKTQAAQSQSTKGASPKIDPVVYKHTRNIVAVCVNKWQGQACMVALSSLNMTLTTTYAQALNIAGKNSSMERLKQNCAASTAALKIDVPAYAMRSAMTQCVNSMVDLSDRTSILPDPSLSQLAVGAILCMDKKPSCAAIENALINIVK